jgi:hypothetical protein
VKYVYLLRVTFEAPDDVAAKEEIDGAHTSERARRALIAGIATMQDEAGVSEKLQRVKDNDQPRLVRRYR